MEEEEVNYASVVFKSNKSPAAEAKKEEETVYDEVKVKDKPTDQTDDTKADNKENNRHGSCRLLACCLGILCVLLLLAIIGVCVYIAVNPTSEQNQLKQNLTNLEALNLNLTNINDKLNSTVHNLTVQFDNLNRSYTALESNNTDLIAENQELKNQTQELETKNQKLETKNQQLETEKKNLTEKIQDMETNWNELNVSRAQWSIDEYCPIDEGRKCESCQEGWEHSESSCYVVHNAPSDDQLTWDEAQAVCKEKSSELPVINNAGEKEYIKKNSFTGVNGYWIGLRVVGGKWEWLDGSDLTEPSWIQPATPTKGHCAISVPRNGLTSVNCSNKNAWICEKKALSLS